MDTPYVFIWLTTFQWLKETKMREKRHSKTYDYPSYPQFINSIIVNINSRKNIMNLLKAEDVAIKH